MKPAAAVSSGGLRRGVHLTAARAWCLGLAVLLLPLVLFERPYLQDFPNHLSRVEIALAIADPAIAANYELLPLRPGNAAFDAVVRLLAQAMPPVEAARLFLIGALVLIATGALALRRAFGLPVDLVALAGLPFVYSASFSYGFLPYLMGMGIALHAMALWLRAGRWPPLARGALAPVAMLLGATHFYALGIFAVFAAAETWQRLGGAEAWRTRRFWLCGLADGLVFVPAVLLLVLFGEPGQLAGTWAVEWTLEKPIQLFTTALGFGPWWMSLAALAAWAAILKPAVTPPAARWPAVRIDDRAAAASAAMFALFVLLPHRLGDLYSVDWRILNCAVLVLLSGLRIETLETRLADRSALRLLALMGAMALALSWLWAPAAAARRDVLAITEAVPPGSRLFWSVPDRDTAGWVSSAGYGLYHAASHAVLPRRILVSTTFALPGQHPLRFRDPSLRDLGNLSMLEARDLVRDLARRGSIRLAELVARFDYVLLYGAPSPADAAFLPMARLRLVSARGNLRLYAVAGR